MKILIAQELKVEDINAFLNASVAKIIQFSINHSRIIETCGIFVKKDNFVLCFCAPYRKECELFVVSKEDKINKKETFEELIKDTSPFPLEYEWIDIEETGLPPHPEF